MHLPIFGHKLFLELKRILYLILGFFIVQSVNAQVTGKISASKVMYKANTVVYIKKAKGNFSPLQKNPVMDQKDLKFIPHVLPVLVGTTVDFKNSDDVLHNVFSPDSCAGKFNLGTWPKNDSKTHKYDKLGCESVLLCNVHPEMEAYILVLQNPYFAVTDREGNFKIENVPPGNYTLKVWNERLKAKAEQITVPQTGNLQVNFELIK